MKSKHNILTIAKCSFTALSMLLLFGACEKETRTGVQNSQSIEQQLLDGARKNLRFVMPQAGNRFSAPGAFNFSQPSSSNTYSNGDGSVSYSSGTSGTNFSSSVNLTIGGSGSATIDGKSHNFDYVICGDLFGELIAGDGEEEESEEFHFTVFFGISGDFISPDDIEIESIFEFISYQENASGTVDLGGFEDFDEEDESSDFGFLFFMDFSDFEPEGEEDGFGFDPTSGQEGVNIFFSYDGSASVSPGSLSFSNVDMIEILEDNEEGDMVKASGSFVCN